MNQVEQVIQHAASHDVDVSDADLANFLDEMTEEEAAAEAADAEDIALKVHGAFRAYVWRNGRPVPIRHEPVRGMGDVVVDNGWKGPFPWRPYRAAS